MRDDRGDDAKVPRIVGEAGGPVDEASATLALYAEDLEPDLVTAELECLPTHAFKKGYARKPGAKQMPHGACSCASKGLLQRYPTSCFVACWRFFRQIQQSGHAFDIAIRCVLLTLRTSRC